MPRPDPTVRFLAACMLVVLSGSTAFAQDMPLTQVLLPGEGWHLVGSGYRFTEGPAVDARGNVFFTDIPNDRIHRIDATTGTVTVFAEKTARTNGLMFGNDGLLYGCRNGDRQVVAASLAPLVKAICSASQPTSRASSSRALSTSFLAARPSL